MDGRKSWVDNVLGKRRVASHVAFGQALQVINGGLAEDVAKVQVGVDNLRDVFAAHLAPVALVASRHGPPNEFPMIP